MKYRIHFIGIYGVSMSSLAFYLRDLGHEITGSDVAESMLLQKFNDKSIKILPYNHPSNVINKDAVVYTSAIQGSNKELLAAKDSGVPILSRAELLSYIGRGFSNRIGISGCHGKTTVTAMIALIFKADFRRFFAHIGGFDKLFGNSYFSGKDWLISEVCEYSKNINLFDPTVAVALNIDNDHLNSYENMEELTNTFYNFLDKAEIRIVCEEDARLYKYPGKKVTFGLSRGTYTVRNLRKLKNNYEFSIFRGDTFLLRSSTKDLCIYSVYNALAAATVCLEIGVDPISIEKGLAEFSGVERRNEYIGDLFSSKIYADYCHHPTEISAFLNSIELTESDLVIFEPHTYSRTKILFESFVSSLEKCPNLIIYQTYAAREEFDYSGSGERLALSICGALYINNFSNLIEKIVLNKYQRVFVLGAGLLYDNFKKEIIKEPSY